MVNQHPQAHRLDPLIASKLSRRQFLERGAALGAGAAFAPLLAACATDEPDDEAEPPPDEAIGDGETLTVLLANHVSFYAMVTPEFEEQHNVNVEFTREEFGAMPGTLTPAFEAGGESWDVVYLWRAWVEQYREFITPLHEIGEFELDEDDLLPAAAKTPFTDDGTLYGGPSNVYTYVLHCNRNMFEDAGIAIPGTYDDFVQAAAEFSGNGQYGYVDGWAPLYLFPKWCVWLHLNDGDFYDDAGNVLFDTPEAMQATQDMIDLLPYMPEESIESPWGIYDVEAKRVFYAGESPMIISYQHILYEGRDPEFSPLGDDWIEVALVPGKGGDLPGSGTQAVGECFSIPDSSPRKELALELVKFYSSKETQLGLLTRREELNRFDPADESGFPSYMSLHHSDEIPSEDRDLVDVTLEQQDYRYNRYGTRPGYQQIADIIEAAVSAALHGSDVESEHQQAQQEIDAFLDENPDM